MIEALSLDLGALAGRSLAPIEVAVVDSGKDASHPDLAGRVIEQNLVEQRKAPGGEREKPRLLSVPLGTQNDSYWHGTAVGGLIASIAPNARLIDVRVLGADNKSTAESMLLGLHHAIERGARVINLSLAASDSSKAELFELLERAHYRDQIVVAARRNFPAQGDGWPAALSACIGVGRDSFERASQFRWRQRFPIEVFARGEDVTVAVPGAGYTTTFGTSFATPAVAALVTLLLGAMPELGPPEIRALLKAHAIEVS
jgi:subtilisin family serine protease